MKVQTQKALLKPGIRWLLFGIVAILLCTFIGVHGFVKAQNGVEAGRLITVYDRGSKSAFLSKAKTLDEALQKAGISLDPRDTVEPSPTEELVAPEYKVNIYRARPVVVVDGAKRTKVMTPYQTAERIALDGDTPLLPGDTAKVTRSTDFVGDGAGLQLTIDRAVPITLDLYGRKTETRTQGDTVAEMLKEKDIVLSQNDRVSLPLDTPITQGLEVRVWREGKQTTTVDQPVPFSTEQIYDADRPIGYRAIQTLGMEGVKTITYEIEIKDGQEVSRNKITEFMTKQPVKQTVVVGIKANPNALTKAKGAQFFTDSKGIVHRETYYDLDMSRVMQSCGQRGVYSVRVDGAKVDADGYVIIAANYQNYPKCSIVETSMGPGKVYDTGGFAERYPHGFDLAADWSRADGI
jgi:uncharacterized protein YabE (DUF348 family)